jgi:hydrogenase maturation factor
MKEGCAIVQFTNGKKRAVITNLVDKLRRGDRVMIHYGYAVERV